MKLSKFIPHIAIFIGSFLVFGVQPLVGNTLLPFFGGTAAVWTVCLCAFQTLLLGGYFYAHFFSRRRERIVPHICLLMLSALWIGFISFYYKTLANYVSVINHPAIGALAVVLVFVGVPYIVLSSNASLVQSLCSSELKDRSVYKLYAVSNIGSFCGLLAYPLLIEPNFSISQQWLMFAAGTFIYGVILFKMRYRCLGSDNCTVIKEGTKIKEESTAHNALLWVLYSALSCFMLNGISAHLCNDITPLPLMWAVMLALYLLSWTFGFTEKGARLGPLTALLTIILSGLAAWHILKVSGIGFYIELAIGCLLILFGGWTIHARLYKSRPCESLLTNFYLMIAIGGALGGTVASLVFPSVFSFVVEYPVALTLLLIPTLNELWNFFVKLDKKLNGELAISGALDWKIVIGVLAAFFAIIVFRGSQSDGVTIYKLRNFYGVSRVIRERVNVSGGQDYDVHAFEHGTTRHGQQPVWIGFREKGTMYFGPHAGGLAICSHPKYKEKKPMRVALAGMGIGTLATYCREGDYYRFYEINPQVVEIASNTNLFWYVSDCKGKLDIVIDDARRALEKERSDNEDKWDVIVIDVFSGDSIPPHLATREAFRLYLDRLAPDGIICMHITNWHLSFSPLAKAVANEFNLHVQGLGCWADKWSIGSYWVFFSSEKKDFFIEGKHGRVDFYKVKDIPIMTDDKHSLLPYLSLNPMPVFE